jgi:hypothetical protein
MTDLLDDDDLCGWYSDELRSLANDEPLGGASGDAQHNEGNGCIEGGLAEEPNPAPSDLDTQPTHTEETKHVA